MHCRFSFVLFNCAFVVIWFFTLIKLLTIQIVTENWFIIMINVSFCYKRQKGGLNHSVLILFSNFDIACAWNKCVFLVIWPTIVIFQKMRHVLTFFQSQGSNKHSVMFRILGTQVPLGVVRGLLCYCLKKVI